MESKRLFYSSAWWIVPTVGGIAVLSKPKRYVTYKEAAQASNIVVEGATNDNCKLILSHWPKSGTSWPLKADTSAYIVFNYLDGGRGLGPDDAQAQQHESRTVIDALARCNAADPRGPV
jgi:hypothetical protein